MRAHFLLMLRPIVGLAIALGVACAHSQETCESSQPELNFLSVSKVIECIQSGGLDGARVDGFDLARAIASTNRPLKIRNVVVDGQFYLSSAAQLRTGEDQIAAYCAGAKALALLELCRTDEEYMKLRAVNEYLAGNAGVRTLSIDIEFIDCTFKDFMLTAERMIIRGRLVFRNARFNRFQIGPAILVRPMVFDGVHANYLTLKNVLALDVISVRGVGDLTMELEDSLLRKDFDLNGTSVQALYMKRTVIEGNFIGANARLPGLWVRESRFRSNVDLRNARLPKGEITPLRFSDTMIDGQLDLSNATIEGEAYLGPLREGAKMQGTQVLGTLQ